MTTDTIKLAEQEAARIGTEHGKNAASWYFDGNTTDETHRNVLKGIEEGDGLVLDTFPSSPLSGEWADGYSMTDLANDVGVLDAPAMEWFDGVCLVYEDAYSTAVHDEIERMALDHVQMTDKP